MKVLSVQYGPWLQAGTAVDRTGAVEALSTLGHLGVSRVFAGACLLVPWCCGGDGGRVCSFRSDSQILHESLELIRGHRRGN